MTETMPLTSLLYLPLLGAIALLAIPRERNRAHWAIAIGTSLLTLIPCIAIIRDFRNHIADMQFVETSALLETLGMVGVLGVDGISLWLVALTVVLIPVVLIGSIGTISYRVRDFAALVLLIEAATIGALCTSDLLVLFVFWQLMLIPTYLLIKVWGGDDSKAATTKFVMFTGTGSALLLIGILLVICIRSTVIPK